MKDLGVSKKILKTDIHRDKKVEKLWLSQKGHTEKILQKFSIMNAKPKRTPLVAHFKLSTSLYPSTKDEVKYMAQVPLCQCNWLSNVFNDLR